MPVLIRLRTNPSSYVPFWAWPQSGADTAGSCLPSMLSSLAERSLTLRRSIVLLRHPDATWADSPQMRFLFSPQFIDYCAMFPLLSVEILTFTPANMHLYISAISSPESSVK